ncbi:hypothetical protein H310_07932 [Aphanomyces invadans]|uniref:Uncharacterized protein n=1 Tax=Aphanomyces invadans TaxID=157072 RepID=A0A024U218_9STRA|nr:hypothetical protein H310_07932 [Aphanomyces invadans]ETV99901.1 hypothetical protein H310_07932 [Aphanomyces invadans]|eukprot:XP_008871677.1 hypothetical protein H310_07932 [Aphanomyces invadans]
MAAANGGGLDRGERLHAAWSSQVAVKCGAIPRLITTCVTTTLLSHDYEVSSSDEGHGRGTSNSSSVRVQVDTVSTRVRPAGEGARTMCWRSTAGPPAKCRWKGM